MFLVRGLLALLRAASSGALLVNAVPHTVRGLTGQPFPTPFADPPGVGLSDPATNVAWGMANLGAGMLLHRRHASGLERAASFAGALGTALTLAGIFGSNPKVAPKRSRRR